LFVVLGVSRASSAQVGLVLSYTSTIFFHALLLFTTTDALTASLTQAFGMLTRQTAEVEVMIVIW
jgi:hypothetical protein